MKRRGATSVVEEFGVLRRGKDILKRWVMGMVGGEGRKTVVVDQILKCYIIFFHSHSERK
jgi:hypothetical protein